MRATGSTGRGLYLIVAIACAALVQADCGRLSSQPQSVRIANLQLVGSLPVFVALDQHLFEKANLSVKTVDFSNSNDAINALLAGQVDLIPTVSLVPVVNVEIRQPRTIRLFAHSKATPERASDSIVVASASHIKSIQDLAGQRVGVFPGTTATKILIAFLKRSGVATDTMRFIPLAPALQLGALSSGAVDAVYGYEPTTTSARLSGGFRTLYGSVYASLANPSVLGGAVIARSFEASHPTAAARVVDVIDAAVRYTRDHPQDARTLLPRYMKLTPAVADAVTIVDPGLSTENSLTALSRMIDLLFDIGEIPEKIEPHRLVDQ